MLSRKAKYAIRALSHLARDGAASASLIAQAEAIPFKFLEAILVELREAGLVTSRRGKYGGHDLARPADEITLADVIRAVDGPLAMAPCASRTAYKPCDDCPDVETCALRPALIAARDAAAAVLETTLLSQIQGDGPSLSTPVAAE